MLNHEQSGTHADAIQAAEMDAQSRRCGAATVARLGVNGASGRLVEWSGGQVECGRLLRRDLLRRLRFTRGLTQVQLADAAGVSRTRIALVETDEETVVRCSTARAILNTLHAVLPLTQSEQDCFYRHFRVTLPGAATVSGMASPRSHSPGVRVAGDTFHRDTAISESALGDAPRALGSGTERARRGEAVAQASGGLAAALGIDAEAERVSLERIAIAMRSVEHAVRELAACVEMELAGAARVGKASGLGDAKVLTSRYVAAAVRLGQRPAGLDGERADLAGPADALAVGEATPGDDGHAGLLGGVVPARSFDSEFFTRSYGHGSKAGVA